MNVFFYEQMFSDVPFNLWFTVCNFNKQKLAKGNCITIKRTDTMENKAMAEIISLEEISKEYIM